MSRSQVTEAQLVDRFGVDPKTVSRWLRGRTPQARFRADIAVLVGATESELWPALAAAEADKLSEVQAIFSDRSAVPHRTWVDMFTGATDEIGVLVYSGLFLAEDRELTALLMRKAGEGVRVRLLLGDPEGAQVARRGAEEGIGSAMSAKVRNALLLFRPLQDVEGVEIRLHDTTLYGSIFRGGDDMLVNQHVYGLGAAFAPVIHLRKTANGRVFNTYADSFDQVWNAASWPSKPAKVTLLPR